MSGPRRTPGPRWRARCTVTSSWANGSGSPCATSSCSATRSRPVTNSVTGCSTCSRVFISRKYASSPLDQELDGAGVDVADLPGQPDRGPGERRRRTRSEMVAAGASSITFWWRRCTEQSRSKRCTHGAVRVGEDLHLDVPAVLDVPFHQQGVVAERGGASRRAAASAAGRSAAARTIRMPLPPPPAAALTSNGNPISAVARSTRSAAGRSVAALHRRQHRHPGQHGDLAGRCPCGPSAR